jgi:predicted CopG family antitoxin
MNFTSFYLSKQYADVTLSFTPLPSSTSTPKVIKCHKILLAGYSGFFDDLFSGKITMNKGEYADYILPFPDPGRAFEELLQFIYSQNINITLQNFLSFIELAEFLRMPELLIKLRKFVSSTIIPEIITPSQIKGILHQAFEYALSNEWIEKLLSSACLILKESLLDIDLNIVKINQENGLEKKHFTFNSIRDSILIKIPFPNFHFLLTKLLNEKNIQVSINGLYKFIQRYVILHTEGIKYMSSYMYPDTEINSKLEINQEQIGILFKYIRFSQLSIKELEEAISDSIVPKHIIIEGMMDRLRLLDNISNNNSTISINDNYSDNEKYRMTKNNSKSTSDIINSYLGKDDDDESYRSVSKDEIFDSESNRNYVMNNISYSDNINNGKNTSFLMKNDPKDSAISINENIPSSSKYVVSNNSDIYLNSPEFNPPLLPQNSSTKILKNGTNYSQRSNGSIIYSENENKMNLKNKRDTSNMDSYPIYVNIKKMNGEKDDIDNRIDNEEINEEYSEENSFMNPQSIPLQPINVSNSNDNNMKIPPFPKSIMNHSNNSNYSINSVNQTASPHGSFSSVIKPYNENKKTESPRPHVRFKDIRNTSIDSSTISHEEYDKKYNNYDDFKKNIKNPEENSNGFKVLNVRPGYEFPELFNSPKQSFSPNVGKKRRESFFKKMF